MVCWNIDDTSDESKKAPTKNVRDTQKKNQIKRRRKRRKKRDVYKNGTLIGFDGRQECEDKLRQDVRRAVNNKAISWWDISEMTVHIEHVPLVANTVNADERFLHFWKRDTQTHSSNSSTTRLAYQLPIYYAHSLNTVLKFLKISKINK